MINISEIVKDWKVVDGWKVAPAGLDWIEENSWIKVGENVTIGDDVKIGDWVKISYCVKIGENAQLSPGFRFPEHLYLGPNSKNHVVIGYADGYWKQVCEVDGVAYIGAGCQWFTLSEAKKHWENHRQDRTLTLILLASAFKYADHMGLKYE